MGAVGFACIQIILADVDGLAAGGAGYLIEGLAGDVVISRILILVGCVVIFVLGILVFVQVGFQILQLLAQVVDLVVGAGHIFIDAVHSLCQFAQQFAHGLDDLAFFGVLINAEAVDQALQVCSFFLHREYLLSQNSSSF